MSASEDDKKVFDRCWGDPEASGPDVEPFTRITVPMCFYKHPRRVTLLRALGFRGWWLRLLDRICFWR